MLAKRCSGSERVTPGSLDYLAIERACQGAFASHPEGMALLSLVLGLDPQPFVADSARFAATVRRIEGRLSLGNLPSDR